MSYKLFLDDWRDPVNPDEWVIARSYDEAVEIMTQRGMPNFVSFDHDLSEDHYANNNYTGFSKTGYDLAKWFMDQVMLHGARLPDDFAYSIHSMNPVGSKNIDECMKMLFECIAEYGYPTNEELKDDSYLLS